jgi:hypothetical protein
MRAQAGDRLVVRGHRVGEHERDAEILEVRGPEGTPPYIVRWSDTGDEGLVFPGSDATVEHHDPRHLTRDAGRSNVTTEGEGR